MTSIAAFPRPISWEQTGMSLRDYFAAAALQGYLAAFPPNSKIHPERVADVAYALADAMIAERAKA